MTKVNNQETLLRFIKEVDGLHDALLHEVVLLHPGYVDHQGRMFGDGELPSAQMFFQSQFVEIAVVEVSLKGISRFRLDPLYELRLEAEFEQSQIVLYPCGKQHAPQCEIRCREMEYRLLGKNSLGSQYVFARGERP